MTKRKRHQMSGENLSREILSGISDGPHGPTSPPTYLRAPTTVQIITGSYEKTLHGITATIIDDDEAGPGKSPVIEFTDTFLFNAHGGAVRCLALSPPSKQQKMVLASGSSDQIINLYHISVQESQPNDRAILSATSLTDQRNLDKSKNRELGSLHYHNAGVNVLQFPSCSKLLSGADDNSVAICRTRDWTVLSTIKVPTPKVQGRASGETAPLSGGPTGVNAFAIHPSMKLMVSVSKGEKCMRLWNLATGKKAGVLNFDKELLQAIGEGKREHGEGLKVEWNDLGEEFVVSFERGAIVFGLDSKPKARVILAPITKIHQIRYLSTAKDDKYRSTTLAISTEDGRIIFFSTGKTIRGETIEPKVGRAVPFCCVLGQVGGTREGVQSRIKDFEIITFSRTKQFPGSFLLVAGCSSGFIYIWMLAKNQIDERGRETAGDPTIQLERGMAPSDMHDLNNLQCNEIPQLGRLLGSYDTGKRITCLKAFVKSELPQDLLEKAHTGNENLEGSFVDNDNRADT
ncbi:MAG: hypothetical protein Q9214_003313 [Letrouitia sp. 1 TL-2023]